LLYLKREAVLLLFYLIIPKIITQSMDEFKNQPDHEENHDKDPDINKPPESEESPANEDLKNPIEPIISPVAAGFIGLIGGFFLYQVLGGMLTLLVFGFDVENAPVNGIRLMTMAGQILFILLPALIFSKMFYQDVGTIIRAKIPGFKEIALFTLGIIILTPLLQNYLYIQNHFIDLWAESSPMVRQAKSFFDSMNELVEKTYGNLLSAGNIFEGIFVIAVIAVIPAVCEEVMFRGFIQRSFEFKLKPYKAALITAIFFGIYHFNPYGVIPLIVLGFYFGFAAYMSNSIVVPIVLHFFNNFTAVMAFFIIGDEDLIRSTTPGPVDLGFSVLTFTLLLALFSGVVLLIRRYYSQVRNT
jgi:membrane protease YdiL (CAAX protease family)